MHPFRPARSAVLLAWLLLLGAAAAEYRTWTHRGGQSKVEAEFIDANNGEVWLKVRDGKAFNVPLDDLSADDRAYVAKVLRDEQSERAAKSPPAGPATIHYGPGRTLCHLAAKQLNESSGLACSRRQAGLFWSHNDSDNEGRLYLFDRGGRDLGSCRVKVDAYDWEDLASFTWGGKPYLLIADSGNNSLNVAVHMLHVVEEPPIDPERGATVGEIAVAKTIYFSFQDDYRNCEAVGVDPTDRTILLIAKERGPECHAYTLAWPDDDAPKARVARLAATLRLRQVTGLDVSPDGLRAAAVTYNNAFEFVRRPDEPWSEALKRPPREIVVPPRKQGESICYGPEGRTLYLTSERRPTPLIEVPVERVGP